MCSLRNLTWQVRGRRGHDWVDLSAVYARENLESFMAVERELPELGVAPEGDARTLRC